jgi:hypothetical protein
VVRAASLARLGGLGLPYPPPQFPTVWLAGDMVSMRSLSEVEARAAILNVVLARAFGMPAQLAVDWLTEAELVEHLTPPEWQFVNGAEGEHARSFALHLEAVFALAWLLGLAMDLDPALPAADGLLARMPNLHAGETFEAWRERTLTGLRGPAEAAAQLDLYYCLDWAYLEAERQGAVPPGMIDSNALGQRRWALEWAVLFTGPLHGPHPGWEEVDLST